MAVNKNGLGHRPFGEWALDEDELEKQAESQRAQKQRELEQRNAP